MTMETIHFDDKCTIECTRNGQKVEADILTFKENQFLSVVFQKSVKLQLQYNTEKSVYIGNMSGLEFITEGPEKFVSNTEDKQWQKFV